MATCRKKAAEMRARYFPKATTKQEEAALQVQATAEQDMAQSKAAPLKSRDTTLDLVQGLLDKAKTEGLIVKPEPTRETVLAEQKPTEKVEGRPPQEFRVVKDKFGSEK